MKLSIILALLITGSLIFLNACKTTQKALSQEEIESLPKILEYAKSGCRGKCPVFDFTVYEGGWAVFHGRAWTKYEGKATTQLSKEEMAQLQANCQKADLWNCQTEYGMNIMDIPTTTVHFYEKNRDRKIQWRIRAPEELPNLSNEIMELIYAREWLEPVKKDKGIKMPAGAIHNEIIVQFKEKVNAKEWCLQFEQYGMVVKKPLSTLTPLYLFKFDTGKMGPDRMLKMIQGDAKVESAEFNKRMKTQSR